MVISTKLRSIAVFSAVLLALSMGCGDSDENNDNQSNGPNSINDLNSFNDSNMSGGTHQQVVGDVSFEVDGLVKGSFQGEAVYHWHDQSPVRSLEVTDEDESFALQFENVALAGETYPEEGSHELSEDTAGEFEQIAAFHADFDYVTDQEVIDFLKEERDQDFARFQPIQSDEGTLDLHSVTDSGFTATFEFEATIRNHGGEGWMNMEVDITNGTID